MLKLSILPSDLVLEVGSGDDPYPQSDVLVDKFLDDSSQRESNFPLVVDRLLILADACRLPFKDKAFDYVIASHILEHMDNPKKFLSEITRVAKRGYIETPSIFRERVFNWSFHRWYVEVKNKALYLTRKTKKSNIYLHNILSSFDRELLTFFEGSKLLNCSFEWKEKVDFKIRNEESKDFLITIDQQLKKMLESGKIKTIHLYTLWLLRRFFLKSKILPLLRERIKYQLIRGKGVAKRVKKVNLALLLACPICRKSIVKKNRGYYCNNCIRFYPKIKKKIINFLLS